MIPIVVPSMNKPNSKLFARLASVNMPKFVFVRKEQWAMYNENASFGWNVIALPSWVDDIGSTRKAIMKWLWKHGYRWAFMLDDDIAYVGNVNYIPEKGWKWEYTGKDKIYFKTSVFRRWYQIAKKYNLSLSAPCHRFHDHNRHGNKILVNKAACIQCVLVNVHDILAAGNYRRMSECGNEDYSIQYFLMKSGKRCGMICNLLYDAPAIGGVDKYPEYIAAFKKNVCNDPELIATKITRSGVPSIKFVWKNWKGIEIGLEEENGQD